MRSDGGVGLVKRLVPYTSAVILPQPRFISSLVKSGRFARCGASLLLGLFCASLAAADIERTGGPYVPTPQAVVDAMLDLAKVGSQDFVVDLGSGDGRIVLTAAQRYSARGQGFDIDPELVQQSNEEAQKRGLAERVSFVQQDVLQARVEPATVVTLYLLPGMMQSLQAKLLRELKPGTRIVSHDFPFSDWRPDDSVIVDVPEKYGTPGQWKSTLFYWMVPARVDGVWQVSAPVIAPEPLALTLKQQYQFIDGATTAGGKRVPLAGGKVQADRIAFKLSLPDGAYDFSGMIEGDRIRGDAVRAGRTVPWTAVRTASATPVSR
jgi:SAM-dependent methyltransferase